MIQHLSQNWHVRKPAARSSGGIVASQCRSAAVAGAEILAAGGNAVSYFHFDRVGSTLALTDAAGTVTDAYAYSAYGILVARTGASPVFVQGRATTSD